jgi:prefoldin subunit 5
VTSESTTRWPLLEERAPFATASTPTPAKPRRLTRSSWVLIVLAFICGGLVSAAAFSIGWRHQAQHDSATQAALAAATARVRALENRVTTLRTSLDTARRTAARERATEQALTAAGSRAANAAGASSRAAGPVSSGAGTLTASASRIASELKTLDTYLTTTPAAQLDPGYVASQATYLDQQLTKLQANAGDLGDAIASFEASLRTLTRDARTLSHT